MPLPNWFAVAGIVLWVGYEVLLRRRSDAETATWETGDEDRRSTQLLIATYGISVVLLVVLGNAGIGTVAVGPRWIGVGMVAAGLAIRAWGMSVLGRFYTRTVRIIGEHQIVHNGPYRLVRHPGYAGSILVWTGYCLGIGNWIALIVVAVLMILAYSWRIRSEEQLLSEHFGQSYRDYQHRTARLIPFVY